MSVKRIDRGQYSAPQRMDNGWLRVDATLTRTGVFEYRLPDGNVRRELRLPEEVFKADALKSFELVPLTLEHPDEFLTAENTKAHSVGSVGQDVRRDGDFVRSTLMCTDGDAVKQVTDGSRREVSCGYLCDLEMSPGEWNGLKYDAIQRNIRGNHVALVVKGRAGPEARVRMDAGIADVVPNSPLSATAPEATLKFAIRLDGVTFETEDEKLKQFVERELTKKDEAIAAAKAEVKSATERADKLQAKADALEKDVATKDAALKEAPKKVREEMKARLNLESKAKAVLGDDAKLDGLSDKDVKAKVLAKTDPELKLDGKSDAYVDARFDLAIEREVEDEDDADERATTPIHEDGDDERPSNEHDARERMKKQHRDAHKKRAEA